jgi:hypothetical protein
MEMLTMARDHHFLIPWVVYIEISTSSSIMDSHKPRINGGMIDDLAGQWCTIVGRITDVRCLARSLGSNTVGVVCERSKALSSFAQGQRLE